MRHSHTNERLVVHTEGDAGPYLTVPPDQTAEVIAEIRAAGFHPVRDAHGVGDPTGPSEEIVNFSKNQDPVAIQRALDAAEYGFARVLPLSMMMKVRVRKRAWEITLSRVDRKPDHYFDQYQGKPMSPEEIKEFIPDGSQLLWQDQPAAGAHPAQSQADDGIYRITLTYPPSTNPAQVKAEFAQDFA